MSSANLLPLPVLLPLLGAALTLVARRHRRTQVAISLGVLAASLAVAVTGATGRLGSRVVDRLLRGASPSASPSSPTGSRRSCSS